MSVELTEGQKEAERIKAQQYAELSNTEYVDPHPVSQQKPGDTPPADAPPVELSNEQLLELINKRSGITLSSFEELHKLAPQPTEEQIQAQKDKRKTDMHIYGLTSGKFTQAEWDAYQSTLANKKDLVRTEITAQLQTAYPELPIEAIEEKVANYLFEHLEEADPLRVAREKELATLSDLQIKNKFKNIVNLPKDFEQYEEGVTNKTNFENKVKATLPVYKSDVKRALESLRNFSVEVPDKTAPGKSVKLDLQYFDDQLNEVEELFLTNDQIVRAVKDGLSFEQIKGEAELVLVKKHLPELISQAAKKYSAIQKENYLNGRRGLSNSMDSIDVSDEDLKDTNEKVYEQLIASEQAKG